MSQVVDYFGPMLGRRRSCWADVGPLVAMFSRLLGTFAWRIIMVVLHIAFCALCTHISMFVFICSLTIILCVLKTVQPTPLVVEPGRYSQKNNSGASACERAAAEHVLGEAGVAVPLDWTAGRQGLGTTWQRHGTSRQGTSWAPQGQSHQGDRSFAALHGRAR